MNSVERGLKSQQLFVGCCVLISVSMFLLAGILTGAVVLFFIVCAFNPTQDLRGQLKEHKLLLLPCLLFILYLIWTVFADNPKEAGVQIFKKLLMLLLPVSLIITRKRLSQNDLKIILASFLAATVVASLFCYTTALYNIAVHKTVIIHNGDRPEYYFSYSGLTDAIRIDPLYLSMFCNFSLIIALNTPFITRQYLRICLAIYIAFFVILIASKIGIITLVVILLYWIFRKTRKSIVTYIILLSFIPLLLFGINRFNFLKDRFTLSTGFSYSDANSSDWSSTTFRLAIWSCALEAISEKPVSGYGTSDGQKALNAVYLKNGFTRGTLDSYNAHNEFMSTELDLGIAGVLVLLALFILAFMRAVRYQSELTIAFILITFLGFMVEAVLLRQKGIVFFTYFISLLLWSLPDKEAGKSNLYV